LCDRLQEENKEWEFVLIQKEKYEYFSHLVDSCHFSTKILDAITTRSQNRGKMVSLRKARLAPPQITHSCSF